MGKLIRMDLYRMFKSKAFLVCLTLTFALALALAPMEKLLASLAEMLGTQEEEKVYELSEIVDLVEKDLGKLPDEEELKKILSEGSPGKALNQDQMDTIEELGKIEEAVSKYGLTLDELSAAADQSELEELLKEKGIDPEAFRKDFSRSVKTDQKKSLFNADITLANILADPFLMFGAMLLMISICSFFYADAENGYIKNIAGQVPKKGYTIVSKFAASIPHNLIFMAAGVIGNLLGCMLVKHISAGDLPEGIGVFFLKLLLMQAICALLVLLVSTFRNKSLGTVIAVVMGLGLMTLMYGLIDTGIRQVLPDAGDIFSKYMPDVLLGQDSPDVLNSVIVSGLFIAIFLNLAVRLFDKKDVK